MFPLILQAHKLCIVTHHTLTTPFLVSLNERESRGGQTVCLSVLFYSLARFARFTRFVRFAITTSPCASRPSGPLTLFTSAHNPLRMNLSDLLNCFTIRTVHVLPPISSHVLTMSSDMLNFRFSNWNHVNYVIEEISSPNSFFKDVPASKIHYLFNSMKALMFAGKHTSVPRKKKEDSTKDLVESSF